MKKMVLLVMLAMCLVSLSASVWAAVPATGGAVYQVPPEPKDPPK
jgi:hypothetical protein